MQANKSTQCTILSFDNNFRTKENGKVYQIVEVDVPGIGPRNIQRTLTDDKGNLKTAVEQRHVGKKFLCHLTIDTEQNAIYGEVVLSTTLSQSDIDAFMAL